MQDLLICERNCCVFVPGSGRRELRPGTLFNADDITASRLVKDGYARRLVEPAPLFVDSTTPPKPPKRGRSKET